MKTIVHCPQCHRTYQVAGESLGRSAKCRQCGRQFTLEAAQADTLASAGATQPRAAGSASSAPPPSPDSSIGFQPVPSKGSDLHRQDAYATSSGMPEQLGRFQIRERLGAGAFGAVYRAYDPVLERDVALKVPHPAALATEQDKARFLREPKAAAQLLHPNIVPVYDAGLDGEQLFIASAFIEGQTLQQQLDATRPDFREATRIVIALAGALEYAHGKGIVHRDVKPANIMLDGGGEPLLMDFGLALLRESEDLLTHDGAVLGTPAYMAPEQADRRWGDVGPACDQYSLGVVLYELLCGERPFNGPASLVMSLVANEEPASPRRHNPQISKDLETICLKAMAKRPTDRYAGCEELRDDLRRWLNNEPIRARRVGIAERAVRWSRRQPMAASLTIAVAVVTLAAFALVSWQWSRAVQALHDKELAAKAKRAAEQQATKERTQAGESRAQTRVARQQAQAATQQAQAEARRAEEETARAATEASRAKTATESAQEAERNKQEAQYCLLIRQADAARLANDTKHAKELLQECPAELRHWEWNYLQSRCASNFPALDGANYLQLSEWFPGTAGTIPLLSPSGAVALVVQKGGTAQLTLLDLAGHSLPADRAPDGVPITFISNGSELALQGTDGLKAWNYRTGDVRALGQTLGPHAINADGRYAGFLKRAGSRLDQAVLEVRDLATGQIVHSDATRTVSVLLSGDGRQVAYRVPGSSRDSRLRLANIATGTSFTLSSYHPLGPFSPDGRFLPCGTSDKEEGVAILEIDKQQPFLWLKAAGAAPHLAVYSYDGQRIATLSNDGRLQLWQAANGQELLTLDAADSASGLKGRANLDLREVGCFSADPYRVLFTEDGKKLVVAGSGYVKFWETTGGNSYQLRRRRFQAHKTPVTFVALSRDGSQVATADQAELKVWRAGDAAALLTVPFAEYCPGRRAAFSADGRLVAVAHPGRIELYAAGTGEQVRRLQQTKFDNNYAGALALSSDGLLVASAGPFTLHPVKAPSARRGARRRRAASSQAAQQPNAPAPIRMTVVEAWNTTNGRRVLRVEDDRYASSNDHYVAISPDGKLLGVCLHADKPFRSFDLAVFDLETRQRGFAVQGYSMFAFGAEGRQIVHVSEDVAPRKVNTDGAVEDELLALNFFQRSPALVVRDAADGSVASTVEMDPVLSIEFAPLACTADGRLVAIGGRTLTIWDLQSGELAFPSKDEMLQYQIGYDPAGYGLVTSVAFSLDAHVLAAGYQNGTVQLMPLEGGFLLGSEP